VLALEPGAATLLGRLDGSVPLEALFDDPELGRSEALQLVYALVVTGSLALFEPAPPVRSEDLRDRVRAQLEAEMRRIERARRRRSVPTPRPSRARPIDPEEARALAAELDAVTSRLEGQTLYQLLGASPNADEEEVRCAYREVSRELDPDRWLAGRSAPDLARRAEANHLTVVRAFQVLSDERSRRTYAAWRTDPHTQLLPELRAAELVREAEADLEAERFARAAETFHWAAEQHPKDLYPVAAGAYAAFRAGGDPEAALASIRACRRHAPDDPDCLRMEARVLVHAGRSAEAAEVYRAVLAVDPDCTEARAASGTASDGGTRGVMAKVAGGARAWFRGGSEG
jgi:tetratricopeptide (TPR) repeat protein